MVSDEKLASLAVPPTPAQEKSFRHAIGEDEAADHALCHLRDVAEMAQELLAYREAEHAPEWANWFARDADGMGFYYSEKPEQGPYGWFEGGESRPMRDDPWQSTLQERPK